MCKRMIIQTYNLSDKTHVNNDRLAMNTLSGSSPPLSFFFLKKKINERWQVISNNVAFDKCRLRPACAASF